MVGPISLSSKLQLNPRPELDDDIFSIPKTILSIDIETVSIGRYNYILFDHFNWKK